VVVFLVVDKRGGKGVCGRGLKGGGGWLAGGGFLCGKVGFWVAGGRGEVGVEGWVVWRFWVGGGGEGACI